MTSQKKIDANRENSKRSTGPKTPQGKDRSRHNAITHGFFATPRPIKGENPNAYNALAQRLLNDLKPQSAIEEMLVDQILGDMWRLRRHELVERAHLQIMGESPAEAVGRAEGIISMDRIPPSNRTTTGPMTPEEIREELVRLSNDPANEPTHQMRQDFWVKKVLLPGIRPENPQIAYSTLEQMRRTLVRDIVKNYESLAEIQGKNLTMASPNEEPSTAALEENSEIVPAEEKLTVARPSNAKPANKAPNAGASSSPPNARGPLTSRRRHL